MLKRHVFHTPRVLAKSMRYRVIAAITVSLGVSLAGCASMSKQTSTQDVFMPAGSHFSGELVHGIDVLASRDAQHQPMPVLIRVKKGAVLANDHSADIKECSVLASGYASLASDRAYIRTERLTCIREDGRVLEAPLDGYIAGEDTKLGLRGRLIQMNGGEMGENKVPALEVNAGRTAEIILVHDVSLRLAQH